MLVSPANHGSEPRGNGRSGANRGNNLGAGRGFAKRLCRVSRQRKRPDTRFTSMLASSSPMEGADELGRDSRHGRVTEKFGSRRRFPLRPKFLTRSDGILLIRQEIIQSSISNYWQQGEQRI